MALMMIVMAVIMLASGHTAHMGSHRPHDSPADARSPAPTAETADPSTTSAEPPSLSHEDTDQRAAKR